MKFSNTVKAFVFLFMLAVWTNAHAVDAVISFTDNSGSGIDPKVNDRELGFRVQRSLNNGPFTDVVTIPESPGAGAIVQVTDTTLVANPAVVNKYCYRVVAFNEFGNSAFATTQTPGVTDCRIISMLITLVPTGPAGLLIK